MNSPIALFVYQRPEHTKKTIEALKANSLANQSELYIFSDGPKNKAAEEEVTKVRQLIRNISGFKSVKLIESKENKGLAKSIIEGVSAILENNEFVIVVEDDIVTSPFFLEYMNLAKTHYRTNEKVMHVSGYMYPINSNHLPESFFLCQATCWGWGTWARAWKKFEKKPIEALNYIQENKLEESFNLESSYDFLDQIKLNITGEINTWAIFWYFSIFKNSGLSLHPKVSYCHNIGNDGSGEHSGRTTNFYVTLNEKNNLSFPTNISENINARKNLALFFKKIKQSQIKKILLKIRKIILKK